jgi:hypothetical protein
MNSGLTLRRENPWSFQQYIAILTTSMRVRLVVEITISIAGVVVKISGGKVQAKTNASQITTDHA